MTLRVLQPGDREGILRIILQAGLLAGLLDGLDAVVFIGWIQGVPVEGVFQFIASGAVGMKAFHLGWIGAALGVFFHFIVAIGAAAVFYLLTVRWTWPLRAPLFAGPIYGVGVFLCMHFLVVPISAAPKQPPPKIAMMVNLVFSHVCFVGIPIALLTSRAAIARVQRLRPAA